MCGIYGIINRNRGDVELGIVSIFNSLLRHRGPDEDGYFHSDGVLLGMTRLSIIDIRSGHQPLFNEDRTMVLICNGEIYNYRELRAALEKRGHKFSTQSDVEVILHLYEDLGEKAFLLLNGMFSACIYEIQIRKVILARDGFGQKPLYYSYDDEIGLVFASELKVFRRVGESSQDIDYSALSLYLKHRYIDHPFTPYSSIKKLDPGHCLVFEGDALDIRCFFHLSQMTGAKRPSADAYDLIDAAVRRHMISERPVGLFLSGGLDSNILLHHMKKYQRESLHTFSVGFENFDENELENASLGASFNNSIHHEVMIGPKQFWSLLDEVIYYVDEPMADLTIVPLFALAKLARQHVTVVLSGEGADELFGGYSGFGTRLKVLTRKRERLSLRKMFSFFPEKIARPLSRIAGNDNDYLYYYPLNLTSNFLEDDFMNIPLLENLSGRPFGGSISNNFVSEYSKIPDNMKWKILITFPVCQWLPNDLLLKADRMTMAHSLEIRSPFLDMELAEFSFNLGKHDLYGLSPESRKVEQKLILKEAYASRLPKSLVYQQKKGFVIPAYKWLEGPLQEEVNDELSNLHSRLAPLIITGKFHKAINLAFSGDYHSQELIWSVVILNKWLKINLTE